MANRLLEIIIMGSLLRGIYITLFVILLLKTTMCRLVKEGQVRFMYQEVIAVQQPSIQESQSNLITIIVFLKCSIDSY